MGSNKKGIKGARELEAAVGGSGGGLDDILWSEPERSPGFSVKLDHLVGDERKVQPVCRPEVGIPGMKVKELSELFRADCSERPGPAGSRSSRS